MDQFLLYLSYMKGRCLVVKDMPAHTHERRSEIYLCFDIQGCWRWSTACAPCSPGWPTWETGLPVQPKSANVSGRGSVSGLRKAAYVGGSRERARPVTRGALTPSPHATRLSPVAHELAHTHAHAARRPALRAARNYPTTSSYQFEPVDWPCIWILRA